MAKVRKKDPLPILYQQMADLTAPKCAQCRAPHRCCSNMYCEMARDEARENGVELEPTGHPTLLYMGPGGCVAPPHFRKLCTLHVCSINSLGFDPEDPEFTEEYFELRRRLEREEYRAWKERKK